MNYIYYFTGTGNSLQIAQDIAEKLENTEITKIAEYTGEKIECDTLGIVFPVYSWGIPLIIRRFLDALQVSANTYIYAVTNFNCVPGKALDQCKERLEGRNLSLSAGYLIPMPGNYIPLYGAISEKKQKKIFQNEKSKVEYIADNARNKKKLRIEKSHLMFDRLLSKAMNKMVDKYPEEDVNYNVSGACISCGKCSKACPVHNIVMIDGKPVWQHKCEMCMACIQYCPKEAIEYGDKTKGRKRYQNPNVKGRS